MTRTSTSMDSSSPANAAEPTFEKRRTPTNEEIALRAYEIYQARGAEDGLDLDDWLQAERELSEPAK